MSDGDIRLVGLVKRYHDVVAVDGIDLHITPGEFFTMLGPSGCGKTTTLRLIAGFERPDDGKILLDGTDMSHTPPHKRRVNTVFQSYALFPHKSVADNVGFGLRYQRVTKAEAKRRVEEACAMVRLQGLEHRRPGQLSGGQQQRVALARALVLEPPVLLLDEPLGALDARLRLDLQVELKRIQEQLEVTFIYVTHDQDEALTMSDRVAVMRGGDIEQCGEPRDLYESPATAFVANFLGASNLVPVAVGDTEGDGARLGLGSFALRAQTCALSRGADAVAMIRPENVRLEPHGNGGENRLPGMVEEVVYLGFHQEVRVRLATGTLLKADVTNEDDAVEYEQGNAVSVHLPARHLRVLAADSAVPSATVTEPEQVPAA
jgi:spermidine/putrescine transport system ATP-binding protein